MSYNQKEKELNNKPDEVDNKSKRDFITTAAGGVAAVGAACSIWPFIDSLNPSADVLALASIEVDISNVSPGQTMVVKWRGKPIFIKNRTEEEIKEAREVDLKKLPDPELDEERVKEGKDQWLITVGICTHLGCVPIDGRGDYDGWFCPCHGSHYDTSGRIRRGPAPTNLAIPPYEFVSDTRIRIG